MKLKKFILKTNLTYELHFSKDLKHALLTQRTHLDTETTLSE